MLDFTFLNETKLIFGGKTQEMAGQEIKPFSNSVLLVYGSDRIKKTGLYDTVVQSLESENIVHLDLGGVEPNPRLSLVRQGIQVVRDNQIGFILAIGGGSAIDTAKAIAAGVHYAGDVWDLFTGEPVGEVVPIGAILTYPAAGSEASNGAVITNEDGWYKRPVQSESMRPKFAILNPELTLSLPKELTAIGVADIISHLLERYFTQVQKTELIDALIEGTLKTVISNAHKVMDDPLDHDARAELMLASTFAHNDLFSCGRIGDWASHDIEHELSAIYDIAHGAGLSIVMPAWMLYIHRDGPDRFAAFAKQVFGVHDPSHSSEAIALQGIKKLKTFFNQIGLPTSLSDVNIDQSRFSEMANKCTKNGSLGNFKKLKEADVINILNLAI